MIRAVNVSKIYSQGGTKIQAVRNAYLEILRGESVLITGPSGAGKSTLLHVLGGLDKPTDGTLLFDGADLYRLPDKSRSRIRNEKIGFVFQFYHLLPEFTALENVMLPALMRRHPERPNRRDIKQKGKDLLGLVGLGKRLDHRPRELSGGETQRAAIARSLINSPEVLLCDEPAGNLDSKIGKEILEYLWTLKKINGMALVIVTHDDRMEYEFDRRFTISDGITKKIANTSVRMVDEPSRM